MAVAQLANSLRQIQRLFSEGSCTGFSDTQLLDRFATCRDESAFALLLARHGPMVLAVCRGILRDPSDAEDAFQATFLILARKAGSAWAEGQLGGWLHKVAYRIAVRASADASRRRGHERRAAAEAALRYGCLEIQDDSLLLVHEEVARLPAKFRLPVVLCYLEGLTHNQAAVELRCGEATLRRRLASARERLRVRLAHRGFGLTAVAMVASLERKAGATVTMHCAQATLCAVMRVAAGEALAKVVSARVVSLTQGGLTVITHGWKATAFAALSLAVVAGLAGGVGAKDDGKAVPTSEVGSPPVRGASAKTPPARVDELLKSTSPPGARAAEAGNEWPLTLADAFRIALDNSDFVRVFASEPSLPVGGYAPPPLDARERDRQSRASRMVIGRLDTDTFAWHFKLQVMAKLRSVEHQYWSLGQTHVQVKSAERAVHIAAELLNRENTELVAGRGTVADVAEAAQRLEQFNLDLTTRSSDLITTEREFRNVVGLPPADNRRIMPVTVPIKTHVNFDYETCLRQMTEQQPEVVLDRLAVEELAEPTSFAPGSQIRQLSMAEEAAKANMRKERQDKLQLVLHERTGSLARFFLEVEASYKQYENAKRLRSSASQRLEVQRAYHQEGRITLDRLLDAVSQACSAMATEAQYEKLYNIALVNLSEAKGTLLADRNIIVVEQVDRPQVLSERDKGSPPTERSSSRAPAGNHLPAVLSGPGDTAPTSQSIASAKTETDISKSQGASAAKTSPRVWNFSFSIGGDRPFWIKGTISEGAGDRPDATGH